MFKWLKKLLSREHHIVAVLQDITGDELRVRLKGFGSPYYKSLDAWAEELKEIAVFNGYKGYTIVKSIHIEKH